jgi:ribosomal protein L37AE/L43A
MGCGKTAVQFGLQTTWICENCGEYTVKGEREFIEVKKMRKAIKKGVIGGEMVLLEPRRTTATK